MPLVHLYCTSEICKILEQVHVYSQTTLGLSRVEGLVRAAYKPVTAMVRTISSARNCTSPLFSHLVWHSAALCDCPYYHYLPSHG